MTYIEEKIRQEEKTLKETEDFMENNHEGFIKDPDAIRSRIKRLKLISSFLEGRDQTIPLGKYLYLRIFLEDTFLRCSMEWKRKTKPNTNIVYIGIFCDLMKKHILAIVDTSSPITYYKGVSTIKSGIDNIEDIGCGNKMIFSDRYTPQELWDKSLSKAESSYQIIKAIMEDNKSGELADRIVEAVMERTGLEWEGETK